MGKDSLAGKIVKLKSGGVLMTVRQIEAVDGLEVATCEWLVKGTLKSEQFPTAMLVEATPPTPRPRFKPIKRR